MILMKKTAVGIYLSTLTFLIFGMNNQAYTLKINSPTTFSLFGNNIFMTLYADSNDKVRLFAGQIVGSTSFSNIPFSYFLDASERSSGSEKDKKTVRSFFNKYCNTLQSHS